MHDPRSGVSPNSGEDAASWAPHVSPAFLTRLLDTVQQAIIAVDRRECVTFWNAFATRLYGFTRDEALGKNIADLTVPESGRESARAIMDSVWAGNPWMVEFPAAHRNGSSVPARVRLLPSRGDDGQVEAIIGISEDMSAEIAARESMQQNQERFELMLRSTGDAIFDWDVVTDELWGNPLYHEMAGPREPGQSARDHLIAALHPEDRDTVLADAREAAGSGPAFRVEYRFFHHAQQQYVRVLERGFFIRSGEGKLRRVVGVMTDISRMEAMEAAIRASEERFRHIFEESPLGIVIFDGSFHIVNTNSAYRRMLGYAAGELGGRSVVELTHPEDRASFERAAPAIFGADRPYFQTEKRYLRRDQSVVWTSVSATALPRREGAPAMGLALVEDITERKRMVDELSSAKARAEAAAGAKLRFLAQISHEIRSPMSGVLGMLELLDGSELSAAQRSDLGGARQAAMSLLGMLDEILDLTRLDQQRLTLHRGPYSPRQLAAEVLGLYRNKASAKGVTVHQQENGPIPETHFSDPARIRQILMNLVDNALKFTPEGTVTITLSATEAAMEIRVEDTGIGIPAASLETVFDSFSTISAETSASIGGTGLGLAISKRLARLMGGDIAVSSVLGQGTCFALTLPLDPAGTLTAVPPPLLRQPQSFPGRRVLVVEDNPINQRVAAGLLRRMQCDVEVAADGVEALGIALRSRFDLILMDAMMPIMDGFEATAEIRRREGAGRRVPVIGLTALATEDDRERCLAAGMDDYVSKPADAAILADVLRRWLPAGSGGETGVGSPSR